MESKHEHYWFLATTKNSFEPVDSAAIKHEYGQLYQMVEYAYLVCKCTAVKKVTVKQGDKANADI